MQLREPMTKDVQACPHDPLSREDAVRVETVMTKEVWTCTPHDTLARYGVGCMHEVRTGREKQKLVGLIFIRGRLEVPVGANIHCHDYLISLTSRSLDVKRTDPILDL